MVLEAVFVIHRSVLNLLVYQFYFRRKMESINFPSNHSTYNSLSSFKWKRFVNAKMPVNIQNPPPAHDTLSEESGAEVSSQYLDIVNSRNSKSSDSEEDIFILKQVVSPIKNISCSSNHMLNNIRSMKYAQFDDIENLQKMIEHGVSVNATDEYGWSLLMVASCAGSEKVVKYLLSKGARKGRRDDKGNTALYLASKQNHQNVVKLLIKKSKCKDDITEISLIEDTEVANDYFCDQCSITVKCSQKEHETSIVHLLKNKKPKTKPFYGIPRNNKGFQMLLKQGWDDCQGLGPSGCGQKYPIKTKQKKDRLGVGHNSLSSTKKFSAIVEKRVEKERLLSLKQTKSLIRKEKQTEKEIRRMLNEPDFP